MSFLPRSVGETAVLVGFVALVMAVAWIGSAVTLPVIPTWYADLAKPSFTPPNWVFGPVWTTLYLMMAYAAWRVWRGAAGADRGRALALWGGQLALNLAWSLLFFGGQLIGLALVDIFLLLLAIAGAMALFARIDRLAAWLLAPYLAWVAYAAALNFAIWRLNA